MRLITMMSSVNALFNVNYLPTRLLHRNQELQTLTNLFTSGESTDQPTNILIHGSFGIGRTTLLRFFGQHELSRYHRPLINFQYKQADEIIDDTLHTLSPDTNNCMTLPEQWILIKRLIRKAEAPLVFTFDDVSSQTIEVYGKFVKLCKETGISSMATAPLYFPRRLKSDISRFLDVSLELEPFTDHQFLDIVKQRVAEVFPQSVPSHVTEFMADIICMLDFQRPATVVELLQNLHPLLSQRPGITANKIRQACLNSRTLYYDFWSGHLSSFTELDATTILLLQAIGLYFINHPGHIYIRHSSLSNQYQQVTEGIGLRSTSAQFSTALNTLLFHDLLLRSRYDSQNYFSLLPAAGYIEIVDLLLGEYQFEQ